MESYLLATNRRSEMMARIRGKNTKPELAVRRMVHGLGYRYRLHVRGLPGTPDIVLPRLSKIILVHGCFWHRHRSCKYAYMPKSNRVFWEKKFARNSERDTLDIKALKALGWKVLTVWECELGQPDSLLQRLHSFLR